MDLVLGTCGCSTYTLSTNPSTSENTSQKPPRSVVLHPISVRVLAAHTTQQRWAAAGSASPGFGGHCFPCPTPRSHHSFSHVLEISFQADSSFISLLVIFYLLFNLADDCLKQTSLFLISSWCYQFRATSLAGCAGLCSHSCTRCAHSPHSHSSHCYLGMVPRRSRAKYPTANCLRWVVDVADIAPISSGQKITASAGEIIRAGKQPPQHLSRQRGLAGPTEASELSFTKAG